MIIDSFATNLISKLNDTISYRLIRSLNHSLDDELIPDVTMLLIQGVYNELDSELSITLLDEIIYTHF